MIEEHASLMASRAEVRRKIDDAIAANGHRLVPIPTVVAADVERESRLNDPANEQGAASLMAVASGAKRKG